MRELAWFLPEWPPFFGDLALFGALLLAGMLGGELLHRITTLPRVTGYVLVGVLCGPQMLGLVCERLVLSGSLPDVVREASALWARPAAGT